MWKMQGIFHLVLLAQSTFAGPLRRRIEDSNRRCGADIERRHEDVAGASVDLTSLLRFHQTATAYPSASPTLRITNGQPAPSGSASNIETPPSKPTSRVQQGSPRSGQPRVTERPDSGQDRSPSSSNSTSSAYGGRGQSTGDEDTTTLTVTTTVYQSAPTDTSAPANGGDSEHRPPFRTRQPGSGRTRKTEGRISSRSVQSNPVSASSQATQSSRPAAKTTFFVLGSSTLRVTVSQDQQGVASSAAVSQVPPSSDRHTTTTVTQLRTRVRTTTVTPDASSSAPAEPGASSSLADGQSRGAATERQTLPTTFPHFTFNPSSSETPSPTYHPHRTTELPSIITPSFPASSSSQASNPAYASSAPPKSGSSPPPSTSSSGVAGITIVPVNPDATTIYMTRTIIDAGATTTVARVTVTAEPSG